jgi:hypothetical protein
MRCLLVMCTTLPLLDRRCRLLGADDDAAAAAAAAAAGLGDDSEAELAIAAAACEEQVLCRRLTLAVAELCWLHGEAGRCCSLVSRRAAAAAAAAGGAAGGGKRRAGGADARVDAAGVDASAAGGCNVWLAAVLGGVYVVGAGCTALHRAHYSVDAVIACVVVLPVFAAFTQPVLTMETVLPGQLQRRLAGCGTASTVSLAALLAMGAAAAVAVGAQVEHGSGHTGSKASAAMQGWLLSAALLCLLVKDGVSAKVD